MNHYLTQTRFERTASFSARLLGAWPLLAWLWLALGVLPVAAENTGVAEYQIKAVYLYNFTKFTDWPTNAFAAADAPIVIGILGEDPFDNKLDALVKGEVVQGRPLVVRRLNVGDDLEGCQVLFISRSVKDQIPTLLQKLKGAPVLTVADSDGFTDLGGMVNFVLVEEKVKLEINPTAAEQCGLQISAKLLKLARIVKANTP